MKVEYSLQWTFAFPVEVVSYIHPQQAAILFLPVVCLYVDYC